MVSYGGQTALSPFLWKKTKNELSFKKIRELSDHEILVIVITMKEQEKLILRLSKYISMSDTLRKTSGLSSMHTCDLKNPR